MTHGKRLTREYEKSRDKSVKYTEDLYSFLKKKKKRRKREREKTQTVKNVLDLARKI